MLGKGILFGSVFHAPNSALSHDAVVFCLFGAFVLIVLCIFDFWRGPGWGSEKKVLLLAKTSGVDDGRRQDKNVPSPADTAPFQAFAKDLIVSAQARGVPVAALRAVLANLIEAGVYEEDIPSRLLAAAGQLGELRAKLAGCRLRGPRVDEAHSQALASIDRGDFDAATEALRRGREAGWTSLSDTESDEAELYAKEALIEHLRGRYRAAAANYAAAAALALESQDGGAWPYLIGQARELCDDGRAFGNRESLLLAATVCHGALGLVARVQSPDKWAATKHCLGQALFLLGTRDKEPSRLGAAIDAYLAALEEWTRDRSPGDWARAQNDLGDALQALSRQNEDLKAMRDAAAAYRAALTQCQQETAPFEWARTCKSLGDALAIIGIGEDQAEHLIEAIHAYEQALTGTSCDFAPGEWAFTQIALGKALQALGEKECGSGRLYQAVSAYQAAMQHGVVGPWMIAAANDNLGDALVIIAERENSAARLKQAASAYRAALEALPADAAPLERARTHIHLAYVLGALWSRTRNLQCLDEALGAADAALSIVEKAGAPEQLAEVDLARETILAAMGTGKAELAAA